ncbi:esterase/lipase family protein [Streptomyces sp. NPDC102360]|uniref:esterase/lipase family protein n=1 Tax=Streptomyces sp. NPDC102360 TaxID=3366160 RepID=UPI00381ED8B1
MSVTDSPTRTSRTSKGLAAAALCASAALTLSAAPPAHADDAPKLPEGGVAQALTNYATSPGAVAGANDWSCRPSAEHPDPVVLLPGTFFNFGANFVKAAPRLKNAGYCVYAMNYGFTALSAGRVGGLGPNRESAAQLDAFVNRTLASTGAKKVDIIGHSLGGNVPMWWMKKMGGAKKVDKYVGWAPSSHGTNLNGIADLGNALNLMGFVTGLSKVAQFPGVIEQTNTSEYTREMWADGDTVPDGPHYTVVMTKYDTVVTPYASQALKGKDVDNVVLQDACPGDRAGHMGLFNDGPTLQITMNALADGPADFKPSCRDYGLQLL